MEDWQEDTLRYFWRKMKIENCITSEYYDYTTSLSTTTRYQSYAFPNGLFLTCKYHRRGGPYVSVTFRAHKNAVEIIQPVLLNYNSTQDDHGESFEYTIQVRTQGVLISLLWALYELNYAQYLPPTSQDIRMDCPECHALISYDPTSQAIWLKCRNCGHEIFLGGQNYDPARN